MTSRFVTVRESRDATQNAVMPRTV